MYKKFLIVGGLVGAASPLALATPITLQIDINALSAQASGPLSEDFSGTIQLFNTPQQPDPNAQIVDLLVDGVLAPPLGTLTAIKTHCNGGTYTSRPSCAKKLVYMPANMRRGFSGAFNPKTST